MSGDVLERNVARLVQRAYVPALPSPAFRDRLLGLWLGEVSRRALERVPSRRSVHRPALPALRFALAVAALFLAFLLGWTFLGRERAAGREELLARGSVALSFMDGPWRAASARELEQGLQLEEGSLRAATPSMRGITIEVGARDARGELALGAGSALELEQRASVLSAELAAGDLALERAVSASGAPWTVTAAPCRLELAAGRARVHAGAELDRFLLESGSARVTGPFGAAELVPGEELRLLDGEREPTGATEVALALEDQDEARRPLALTAPSGESSAGPTDDGSAPAERALAGRVVDAASNASIERFSIGLLAERLGNEAEPPLVREFDARDGAFRWSDPPAGKQRVFVHAPGYALLALGEHDLGATNPVLEARLTRGASLRGIVVDAAGNPIPGALVLSEKDSPTDGLLFEHTELAYWLPIRATAGADGRFELQHLNPGTHTLRASAKGFAPGWTSGARAGDPGLRQGGGEIVITLGAGGTLRGLVTREDGSPWVDAEIVIVAMDRPEILRMSFGIVRTGPDGVYAVEHLPTGNLLVVLLREDFRPDVKPAEIREGAETVLDFASERTGVRLTGRLLDAAGQPIPHQNLGLFNGKGATQNSNWVATTTLADGSYTFDRVEPGPHFFFMISEMGRSVHEVGAVELPAWPEFQHELRLAPGRITGAVIDGRTGEGVSGCYLLLEVEEAGGDRFSALGTSGAGGAFAFGDLVPRTYAITAYPTRPGLGFARSESIAIVDNAPEPAPIEIALFEGGDVEVVVRDRDGKPLAHAMVEFTDDEGRGHGFSGTPQTDQDGRFRARGVRSGHYQVAAALAGYELASRELQFDPAAGTAEVEIVLEARRARAEPASSPAGANPTRPRDPH